MSVLLPWDLKVPEATKEFLKEAEVKIPDPGDPQQNEHHAQLLAKCLGGKGALIRTACYRPSHRA